MCEPEFDTHKEVLIFYFLSVIQNELNKLVLSCNRRRVRQSSDAPGGNPDLLFHCPPLAFQRKGIQIGQEDINIVKKVLGLDDSLVAINDEMHDLLKCSFQIYLRRFSKKIFLVTMDCVAMATKLSEGSQDKKSIYFF